MKRKSKNKYPDNWDVIARAIKGESEWKCVRCKRPHDPGRVVMEQYWMFEHSEWFRPYVAGYYAAMLGWSDYREDVMDNIEHILEKAKNARS